MQAGRLLIRKTLCELFHLDNSSISLARSDRGRPYCVGRHLAYNGSDYSEDENNEGIIRGGRGGGISRGDGGAKGGGGGDKVCGFTVGPGGDGCGTSMGPGGDAGSRLDPVDHQVGGDIGVDGCAGGDDERSDEDGCGRGKKKTAKNDVPASAEVVDETLVSFNVSHQGDYAVLAAETTACVGVDVMRITYPS